MNDKRTRKQITVRVNSELLELLKERYSYLETESEVVRACMLIAYEVGKKIS